MANIGTFTETDTGFEGVIRSMTLDVKCRFEAIAGSDNDKAPSWRIIRDDGVDLGAAWRKTNKDKKAYVAVKLDDPVLPATIFANLVDQDGVLTLIWVRQ